MLSMVRLTSARPRAGRRPVPAKMTSSILVDRTVRGPWAPSTHATASTTLDLPLPLGPTTTVSPGSNSRVVGSAKDLKPFRVSERRNIGAPRLPAGLPPSADPPPPLAGPDDERSVHCFSRESAQARTASVPIRPRRWARRRSPPPRSDLLAGREPTRMRRTGIWMSVVGVPAHPPRRPHRASSPATVRPGSAPSRPGTSRLVRHPGREATATTVVGAPAVNRPAGHPRLRHAGRSRPRSPTAPPPATPQEVAELLAGLPLQLEQAATAGGQPRELTPEEVDKIVDDLLRPARRQADDPPDRYPGPGSTPRKENVRCAEPSPSPRPSAPSPR